MTITRDQVCLKIIEACEKEGEVRAKLADGTEVPLFEAGLVGAWEVVGKTIHEAASMKFHRDMMAGFEMAKHRMVTA
jgi:hypothetical protein